MEKVYGPEYNEYEREGHVHMLMHVFFLFFFYKTETMILIKIQNTPPKKKSKSKTKTNWMRMHFKKLIDCDSIADFNETKSDDACNDNYLDEINDSRNR